MSTPKEKQPLKSDKKSTGGKSRLNNRLPFIQCFTSGVVIEEANILKVRRDGNEATVEEVDGVYKQALKTLKKVEEEVLKERKDVKKDNIIKSFYIGIAFISEKELKEEKDIGFGEAQNRYHIHKKSLQKGTRHCRNSLVVFARVKGRNFAEDLEKKVIKRFQDNSDWETRLANSDEYRPGQRPKKEYPGHSIYLTFTLPSKLSSAVVVPTYIDHKNVAVGHC